MDFCERTVCPIAAEVSIRASNATVVISFSMMDLSRWALSPFMVAGRRGAQGARTSRFRSRSSKGAGCRSALASPPVQPGGFLLLLLGPAICWLSLSPAAGFEVRPIPSWPG